MKRTKNKKRRKKTFRMNRKKEKRRYEKEEKRRGVKARKTRVHEGRETRVHGGRDTGARGQRDTGARRQRHGCTEAERHGCTEARETGIASSFGSHTCHRHINPLSSLLTLHLPSCHPCFIPFQTLIFLLSNPSSAFQRTSLKASSPLISTPTTIHL